MKFITERPLADPKAAARKLLDIARDAANHITALSKAEQWQTAMEVLLLAAETNGLAMMARIGMMRALHRHSAEADEPTPRRKRAKAYRVIR